MVTVRVREMGVYNKVVMMAFRADDHQVTNW